MGSPRLAGSNPPIQFGQRFSVAKTVVLPLHQRPTTILIKNLEFRIKNLEFRIHIFYFPFSILHSHFSINVYFVSNFIVPSCSFLITSSFPSDGISVFVSKNSISLVFISCVKSRLVIFSNFSTGSYHFAYVSSNS